MVDTSATVSVQVLWLLASGYAPMALAVAILWKAYRNLGEGSITKLIENLRNLEHAVREHTKVLEKWEP